MIPIEYRLDANAEKEYIEKVLPCIKTKEFYAAELEKILKTMEKKGHSAGKKIMDDAQRFSAEYPNYFYLCKWLVLSYEELEHVKEYLDQIIENDLVRLNVSAKVIWSDIQEIKSYHDLKNRRSKHYTGHLGLKELLRTKISYDEIFEKFEAFKKFYDKFSIEEIGRWIVEKTGTKVCPYCNISYTYNRGSMVTAQLDHFFPKSEYPIFSLSFYNLVPSCSACNKTKSAGLEKLTSPYKVKAFENLRITWNYKCNSTKSQTKYNKDNSLKALEEMIEIEILTSEEAEKNNISKMKIDEAYQQHTDYAGEIINKVKTYANPSAQKLICNICDSIKIAPDEVERFYFGNYLKKADLQKRPLAKMASDFYEEYRKLCK